MKRHLIKNPGDFELPKSVVSIGNFDGLHLGHQVLIKKLREKSQEFSADSVVLSFDPHPVKVLRPQEDLKKLYDNNDLFDQLASFEVDHLAFIQFNHELAQMSANDFLQNFILKALKPKAIVIGYDFCFGHNREGNAKFLQSQAKLHDFQLITCDSLKLEGEIVSSSLIRQALKVGNVQKAQKFLGRYFSVKAKVIRGDGRGRKLGIPTANIAVERDIFLPHGVYATKIAYGDKVINGVTNLGVRPTFKASSNQKVFIESHLFSDEKNLDLYDQEIKVQFIKWLRPEVKFSGAEELVRQIKTDIQNAKQALGHRD